MCVNALQILSDTTGIISNVSKTEGKKRKKKYKPKHQSYCMLFYFSKSKKACSHKCPSRLTSSLSAVRPINLRFPKDVWTVSEILSALKRYFTCFLSPLNHLVSILSKEKKTLK